MSDASKSNDDGNRDGAAFVSALGSDKSNVDGKWDDGAFVSLVFSSSDSDVSVRTMWELARRRVRTGDGLGGNGDGFGGNGKKTL